MVRALGNKKLRIAFAGAGAISGFHLKGWAEQTDIEIVAICDPLLEKAQARAIEFGIGRVYTDFERMLRETQPDAVDIATPVATHAPLTRIAADLGVHVSCQKPLTPTVAEAEELIRDVGTRVRFMVHEHFRFRPHYLEMRRWLESRLIGEVCHGRMIVRSAGLVSVAGGVPFLLDRQPYLVAFKRLAIFEVFIHQLDVRRALLGPLHVVSCQVAKINAQLAGEDVAVIGMRGENGLTAVLDGNMSAAGYRPLPMDRFEIIGSKGTMVFEYDKLFLVGGTRAPVPFDMAANYQRSWSGCIADFVHGLRTGDAFQTDRLDNIETLKLMEQAYVVAGVAI